MKFFKKLGKILRKIPVLESLFNEVSGIETCNFIKVFSNTYFVEYLQTAASELVR